MSEAFEAKIQQAIDEWNNIQGGPQDRPGEPSLARYITASLAAEVNGRISLPVTITMAPELSESTQEYEHRYGIIRPRKDGFNPFAFEDACDADD